MKRFYQKQWFDIPFLSFTDSYTDDLPDSEFYSEFYKSFYRKYNDYSQLDSTWLAKKKITANWLLDQISSGSDVLAIGAGIGYMEQDIWERKNGNFNLYVQDFARSSSIWLEKIIPPENIFYHDVAKSDLPGKYDLIYMAGVAYALKDEELIEFLSILKRHLKPEGKLLLLWGACDQKQSFFPTLKYQIKEIVKTILSRFSLFEKGQFWGWMRTNTEYKNLIASAGFKNIDEGNISGIDNPKESYYLIGINN